MKLCLGIVAIAASCIVGWLLAVGSIEKVATDDAANRSSNVQINSDEAASGETLAELVEFPKPESLPGHNVSITMADGKVVNVLLRQRGRLFPYYYPTERLFDSYSALESAAINGETRAAIQLAQSLKACRTALKSSADLDRELELIRSEGTIQDSRNGDERNPIPSGFDMPAYEDYLKETLVLCQDITEEQTDRVEEFLRLAVDGGDYYGIRFLTEELGKTEESFQLWHQAWRDGHINGVTALIYYYQLGIPESTGGQPDHLNAYAFKLIRNKVYEASEEYSQHVDPRRREAYQADLDASAARISPFDQNQATTLATEMLENNVNCCIGSWRW